jgi:hypothetical protein
MNPTEVFLVRVEPYGRIYSAWLTREEAEAAAAIETAREGYFVGYVDVMPISKSTGEPQEVTP